MDHALNVAPVWVVLIGFVIVPSGIAVLLHDRFRLMVPAERLIPHHDVAGFLVSIVGLMYAVVLAFLVAAAWTTFDTAQRNADAEASDVAETFANAELLQESSAAKLRALMADYAFEVRDQEWPMLLRDEQDELARSLLLRAFSTVALDVKPNVGVATAVEHGLVQQVVLNNVHELSERRRQRLIDAGRHIPGELYFALILGWLMLTAFVFLFGVTQRTVQLAMTALVTAMIGLLFGVIVEFDFPYGHGIRVDNDAWSLVIANNHLAQYKTDEPKQPQPNP